ncbi:uncharacterized protein [Halyomorpha halys]|uniref:uncharacterized protein n=1 Tax=Halyomorpha halys TaxID=286706 RepID=UPI0006D508F8|nr:uncharacterized protein LOC106692838 [Halyomorpha halys]
MDQIAVNGKTRSLQEVKEEHLTNMLSQMRNNFPEAIHAYEYVRTLLRYKKTIPGLQISFLAPEGDFRLGVLFFLIDGEDFVGSIYCEDEEARQAMEEALVSTTLNVPFKKMTLLSGMTNNSYLAAKPLIDSKGWSVLGGIMYWMPWQTARQITVNLPEGVEIRKLNREHAELVNKEWPHNYPGSQAMIERQLEFNFGLGVFRGDHLLSWAVHFFYGGVGAVQTLKSEGRKGYAKAVVQAISKKLGEMEIDVHLNVVVGNEPAEAFFKALGFEIAYNCEWAMDGMFNKLH